MQGFLGMLKTVGIDPDKMLADAQAMLAQFENKRDEEHRALMAEFQGLNDKLAKMDDAIRHLDPNYVPDTFKAGEFIVTGQPEPQVITNLDTPEGGPVDMSKLDPARIPGDVSSLEKPQEEPAPVEVQAEAQQEGF